MVSSEWQSAWGADYQINAGTHIAKAVLTATPPGQADGSNALTLITDQVGMGNLPAPSADGQTLYIIYYPDSSAVVDGGRNACGAAYSHHYGGYHRLGSLSGTSFAYALIPTCMPTGPYGLDDVEYSASHEFAEAVTDPDGASAWVLTDQSNPWTRFEGEVGDLCPLEIFQTNGLTLTRVWSNSNAAAGKDPCVPAPAGAMYDSAPMTDVIHHVHAGDQLVLTLVGWSTAPEPAWAINIDAAGGSFQPVATLSSMVADRLTNGQTATLTLTIPAGTPSGSEAFMVVDSVRSVIGPDLRGWPLVIDVD
jgi:hypothetical protein